MLSKREKVFGFWTLKTASFLCRHRTQRVSNSRACVVHNFLKRFGVCSQGGYTGLKQRTAGLNTFLKDNRKRGWVCMNYEMNAREFLMHEYIGMLCVCSFSCKRLNLFGQQNGTDMLITPNQWYCYISDCYKNVTDG